MLQIGYVIICEDTIQDDGEMTIRNPLAAISPIGIPSNYTFKVAFSLHDLEEEHFSEDDKVRIIFAGPDGGTIADTDDLTIQGQESKEKRKARVAEAVVTFNNIDLIDEGTHTLILSVNTDSREIKIPVLKQSVSGDNGE